MPLFLFFNELFFCLFVKIKQVDKDTREIINKNENENERSGGDEKKN